MHQYVLYLTHIMVTYDTTWTIICIRKHNVCSEHIMNAPKDKTVPLQPVTVCDWLSVHSSIWHLLSKCIDSYDYTWFLIYLFNITHLGFPLYKHPKAKINAASTIIYTAQCTVKLLTAPWVVSLGIGQGKWQENWPDIHVFDGGEKPEHPDKTHAKTQGEHI